MILMQFHDVTVCHTEPLVRLGGHCTVPLLGGGGGIEAHTVTRDHDGRGRDVLAREQRSRELARCTHTHTHEKKMEYNGGPATGRHRDEPM